MHILLIDDDTELCELLSQYLEQEGFTVSARHEGRDGLNAARSGDYAFLILDVMLPGCNGFDLLRQLRQHSAMPPFNPRELVARIRAIQRRGENGLGQRKAVPGKIMADDVLIDVGTRSVYQHDTEVVLTAVEFSLLYALVKRIGQVVNREELAQEVLGRKLEMFDRSIDVHISSLRKKLGHHIGEVERIKTIRGIGYMYSCLSEPN